MHQALNALDAWCIDFAGITHSYSEKYLIIINTIFDYRLHKVREVC